MILNPLQRVTPSSYQPKAYTLTPALATATHTNLLATKPTSDPEHSKYLF